MPPFGSTGLNCEGSGAQPARAPNAAARSKRPIHFLRRFCNKNAPLTVPTQKGSETFSSSDRKDADMYDGRVPTGPASGNRIVASRMKGMALGDPLHREPPPAQHAVAGNRRQSVLGTGGVKPAGRRFQGGDETAVETDRPQRDDLHRHPHLFFSSFCLSNFPLDITCRKLDFT